MSVWQITASVELLSHFATKLRLIFNSGERNALQMRARHKAAAEIVDGEPDARAAQHLRDFVNEGQVLHDLLFQHVEDETGPSELLRPIMRG